MKQNLPYKNLKSSCITYELFEKGNEAMKNIIKTGFLAIAVMILCSFESAPSILFASSSYSGHEEITRQALNHTLQKLKPIGVVSLFSNSDLTTDLEPTPNGLFGYKTKNMLIHGNFSMDFPNQTTVMSVAQFWKISDISYFDSANAQVLHFLRNRKTPLLLFSAQETCLQAQKNIKFGTEAAIETWQAGDKTKALFILGLVTHTIQDSFSNAHTQRRSAADNYDLANVCFYGLESAKRFDYGPKSNPPLCYHEPSSTADIVWSMNSNQRDKAKSEWPGEEATQCDKYSAYPKSEAQKESCLNHEARLARLATEKYLFLVFSHLNMIQTNPASSKGMNDFIDSLDTRLFEGPVGDAGLDVKMPLGILRCRGLSNQQIQGIDSPSSDG